MKKLIIVLAILMAVSSFVTSQAQAAVYTPTVPDMLTFVELYDAGAIGTLTSVVSIPPVAYFQGEIIDGTPAFRSFIVGDATPSVTDLSTFTSYGLKIYNDNNQPWDFSLYLKTSTGTYTTAWTNILVGNSQVLNLDFTGVGGLNSIQEIGIGIGFNGAPKFGGGYQGDDFHFYATSPVPEPSSMLLLGMGILGLFGLGKKRA
jgi:hypothetical protein